MRRGKRVRISSGIYQDAGGISATVKVARGVQREKRFPLATSLKVVRRWRQLTAEELRTSRRHVEKGTLAADVDVYLGTLVDRPALQALRRVHLAWWVARFGNRSRHTLTAPELQTALAEFAVTKIQRWPNRPPALPTPATVRHYRTALYSLWTTLDGKDASNPLRDVKPPRSADPEPRALPYEIIDGILAAMPERGQGLRDVPRSEVSKTKARLKVQAYVGLPPKQLMLLRESDVNWQEGSVLVQGRKKGQGTRTTRLPLVPQAVAALREFFDAKAEGRFSTSSARQSFRRACQAFVAQTAVKDPREAQRLEAVLKGVRPYDLRHSYLTMTYLASEDIHATQKMGQHSDPRMTNRYTLAAVDPRLRAAAARLAQMLPPLK
jgi:integrase